MSQEDLEAFVHRIQQDPTLRERLDREGCDAVALARELGFELTEEDLRHQRSHSPRPMSEEELEEVAGGGVGDVWWKINETFYKWHKTKWNE
jgi:predicted ribosomally synthesized peptide with nif11-like leader